MGENPKKKIVIASVCSIVLVAMVVALTIGIEESDEHHEQVPDVSASQKAIKNLCQSTDYQEACISTLQAAGNDTSDPKKLIEIAFQAAMKYIDEASRNSTLLADLEKEPKAKVALDSCRELADRAVNDLMRSYSRFDKFDYENADEMLDDLKIWLSGAITYQETCLDGFEEVPGDAGQKMRDYLQRGMQMSSNGLAMVVEVSSVLESMGVRAANRRRLLSDEDEEDDDGGDEVPSWIDFSGRRVLKTSRKRIKPDLIVAKDGSGKYTTINEALEDVPKNKHKRFVLYIKEGVYAEHVKINSSMTHLLIMGDGPTKTKITGNLNFIDGVGTYHTATVAVHGDYFIARDIGFENSAGPEKHQAVALRVSADKAIFYNCRMDGYQDTLYAHTYRQFYRDCVITGTIDFVFGDSAAVLQGCTLLVRKPLENQQCIITAQGRKDPRQPTGLVLQNCTFKADVNYFPFRHEIKSYLGRPWKEYSRTIIMESFLDDLIQPQGWLPWAGDFALQTLFYTEFNNRGPAANKTDRIVWPGIKELPPRRMKRFTPSKFVEGNKWIKHKRVPYEPDFVFPVPKRDPNVHYSKVTDEETKDLGKKRTKSSYIFKAPPPPHHHSKIPESNIAAPPTGAYPSESNVPAAPAPSPTLSLQPENEKFSFMKLFFRG